MTTQTATYQNHTPGCIAGAFRALTVAIVLVAILVVGVLGFRWLTVDAPPIAETPIEQISDALAVGDMLWIAGNEWVPDVDLNIISVDGTRATITDPDGDKFICDYEQLKNFDPSSCSTSPGETMVKHDMGSALDQLDGAWIWHATNMHTWISIERLVEGSEGRVVGVRRADGTVYQVRINIPETESKGVYKCPNSIMSNVDAMMTSCIRVQDSLGPGGATLGSAYSQ